MVSITRQRLGVGAAYAAQGFGYATAVTALPGLKERAGLDDQTVALVLLLCCLTAAGGSVLAERIAVRAGSHLALQVGLTIQAVTLPLVAASPSWSTLMMAFAAYGVGLGSVDASSAMQGVQLQHRAGRAVLSTLFACSTGAAIAAALTMSGLAHLGTSTGAVTGLVVAAILIALIVIGTRGSLMPGHEPSRQPEATGTGKKAPLPVGGIWVFGSMILVAFVVDSSVSTWSSVYLHDSLESGPVIAPLGYAAYQAAILITRLVGDRLLHRRRRSQVLVPSVSAAVIGLVAVAMLQSAVGAVAAFALVGIGIGALVPLTFAAAGELASERLHEVIARINLFNYVGAVLGAVTLGLLSDGPGLGPAFVLPAALLIPAIILARRFDRPAPLGRPLEADG